jgi:hypothetical protein
MKLGSVGSIKYEDVTGVGWLEGTLRVNKSDISGYPGNVLDATISIPT